MVPPVTGRLTTPPGPTAPAGTPLPLRVSISRAGVSGWKVVAGGAASATTVVAAVVASLPDWWTPWTATECVPTGSVTVADLAVPATLAAAVPSTRTLKPEISEVGVDAVQLTVTGPVV